MHRQDPYCLICWKTAVLTRIKGKVSAAGNLCAEKVAMTKSACVGTIQALRTNVSAIHLHKHRSTLIE